MLSKEQSFFLKILADHLHERETKPVNDLDWSKLIPIADDHQLSAIVYYQCKDFIPEPEKDYFKKTYYNTLRCFYIREEIVADLEKTFAEGNIDYVFVKGLNVAKYYPVPAFRTMGDIDIIVKKKVDAEPYILKNGFERHIDNTTPEWKYYKSEFEIELHNNLIETPIDSVEDEYKDFFNDSFGHLKDGRLEDNYHFVLLVRHMRKHVIGSGIGFRLFYDIAAEIKNNKNLDFDVIFDYLKTVTMKPFALKCFDLCRRWFEIELPFECPKVSEEFFVETTQTIFKNGIFGFANNKNNKAFVTNRYINEKHPKYAMFKRARKFLFPPYSVIKEKYPFFDKKPYLLPVAWIYRAFDSIIKGKGKAGSNNFRESFTSNKSINTRKELYNKWSI